MSFEHVLLGLLRTPATGYEIKAQFDAKARHMWSAELSQIYPALNRLARRKLLRVSVEPSRRGPPRRVYRLTAAGDRALREWLESPPQVNPARLPEVARMFFMANLSDLARTLAFVHQLRSIYAERLAALESIETFWLQRDPAFPDALGDQPLHELFALRFGIFSYRARLAWCDDVEVRIEARLAAPASERQIA